MPTGGRVYTDRITINPPVDMPGDGAVNFYAVDADPNGQLDANAGDRAWQIGSTNKWVCAGGTSWSLDTGGGGGTGWNVIVRPAGVEDPDAGVYTTFEDAYAAAIAIDGEVTMWFDTDQLTPIVVAAGTYDLGNITFKGWVYPRQLSLIGGQHTITTGDDVVFENFINGIENLTLIHTGSAALCTLLPVEGEYLRVRSGSWSLATASVAPIWYFETNGGAPSTARFSAEPYAYLTGAAGSSVIDLQAAVTLVLIGDLCSLQDDFLSGSATSTLSYAGGLYVQASALTNMLGSVSGLNIADLVAYDPANPAAWSAGAPATAGQALDQLVEYVPAVSADWDGDPTGLHNAIDRIAAALAVLIPGPIPV